MARFPIASSRGRRLLSLVWSGEAHPSAAAAAAYNQAPASYWTYTAEASAYLYEIGTFVPTNRPFRRSYAGSARSAVARAKSEAVVSASCPAPSSSTSGGWGFLPLAAAAALGACGGGALATFFFGQKGTEIYKDEDEAFYMNLPYKVTDVSLNPSFHDMDEYFVGNFTDGGLPPVRAIHHLEGKFGYVTCCEGMEIVHPVLRLQGNTQKNAAKCFELRGVLYRLPKSQLCKNLYLKIRAAYGKFFTDFCKRVKESLKKVGSVALNQLKIECEFVLYLLEQSILATVGDWLVGVLVFLITGSLTWLLKGTPYRERFIMEQPEDHLAHLTVKLLKVGAEVTKRLTEHVEMTGGVLAEHSNRILALEKESKKQSEIMKTVLEAVLRIEDLMNAQKDKNAEGSDEANANERS